MKFRNQADLLGGYALEAADRAYVPYSNHKRAVALLLEDGSVILGVRVENASFSLTLSASVNAFSTAAALGKTSILAIGFSEPASPSDAAYLTTHPFGPYNQVEERFFVRDDADSLPSPGETVNPIQLPMTDRSPDTFILAARAISSRAYIPESRFPVGCLIELDDTSLIIGVNVEHPDWPHIICAERNAIGTIVSYGLGKVRNIYLSCPADEQASPCGACRQVLVELAPEGTVWMDRGNENVVSAGIEELLPGHFSGKALFRTR